jgi:hypothetical protein
VGIFGVHPANGQRSSAGRYGQVLVPGRPCKLLHSSELREIRQPYSMDCSAASTSDLLRPKAVSIWT